MRPIKLAASLFAATLVLPLAAHAQEIAGKWTASYPAVVRNTNGVQEAEMGTALMVIEQKGDSVFGTWHPQNAPRQTQPRAFRGAFINGKLTFVTAPAEARVRRGDGNDSPIQLITYFEGALKDGAIDGTLYSQSMDSTFTTRPLKWSAKRAP
jgi:hypothetical protein